MGMILDMPTTEDEFGRCQIFAGKNITRARLRVWEYYKGPDLPKYVDASCGTYHCINPECLDGANGLCRGKYGPRHVMTKANNYRGGCRKCRELKPCPRCGHAVVDDNVFYATNDKKWCLFCMLVRLVRRPRNGQVCSHPHRTMTTLMQDRNDKWWCTKCYPNRVCSKGHSLADYGQWQQVAETARAKAFWRENCTICTAPDGMCARGLHDLSLPGNAYFPNKAGRPHERTCRPCRNEYEARKREQQRADGTYRDYRQRLSPEQRFREDEVRRRRYRRKQETLTDEERARQLSRRRYNHAWQYYGDDPEKFRSYLAEYPSREAELMKAWLSQYSLRRMS